MNKCDKIGTGLEIGNNNNGAIWHIPKGKHKYDRVNYIYIYSSPI